MDPGELAPLACGHRRGTYLLRGRLWAWSCPDCGAEGIATPEDNTPRAALASLPIVLLSRPKGSARGHY
jgi:hypothetical protein